jgi:hypothetical protein
MTLTDTSFTGIVQTYPVDAAQSILQTSTHTKKLTDAWIPSFLAKIQTFIFSLGKRLRDLLAVARTFLCSPPFYFIISSSFVIGSS